MRYYLILLTAGLLTVALGVTACAAQNEPQQRQSAPNTLEDPPSTSDETKPPRRQSAPNTLEDPPSTSDETKPPTREPAPNTLEDPPSTSDETKPPTREPAPNTLEDPPSTSDETKPPTREPAPNTLEDPTVVLGSRAGCVKHPAVWPIDDSATPRSTPDTYTHTDTTTHPGSALSVRPWNGPAVFDLEPVIYNNASAVELVAQPGSGRLFVVGRDGVVSEIRSGELLEPAFLDISQEVLSIADIAEGETTPPKESGVDLISPEQGLLSLAFHPEHDTNNLLYTFHTRFGDGYSIITEWSVAHGGAVDVDSARTVMVFEQRPTSPTHKGGQLLFGPDGLLYAGVGDGGGIGDPYCHGQNPHTPLGAILRIRPEPSHTESYTVPAGNPYADGVSGHPAVWITGLRNPWRFTIDDSPTTDHNLMIIADVGWNNYEEINIAHMGTDAGADFGWSIFEGDVCIRADHCDQTAVLPAVSYTHDEGIAVIGGHTYRGSAIPELTGRYFYSDFTGGWLRTLTFTADGIVTNHTDWTMQLSDPTVLQGVHGFGIDAEGEIYVITRWGRHIYKLVPAHQPE